MKKIHLILIIIILISFATLAYIKNSNFSEKDFVCNWQIHGEQLKNNQVWYFAYGSNLSHKTLKQRIGSWKKAQPMILNNYQRVFASRFENSPAYANIIEQSNAMVEGGLYLIAKPAVEKLDLIEGAPNHYKKILLPFPEQNICAYAYQFSGPSFLGTPSASYLETVKNGLSDFGYSAKTLDDEL